MKRRCAATFAAVIALCAVAPANAKDKADASPYGDVRAYVEAMSLILNNHVRETSVKELTYAAIEGMVASLDPYSNYLQSDEAARLTRTTAGKQVGIGVVLSIQDGRWTVDYPIPGSPAFNAGIEPGDEILAVDSVDTAGVNLDRGIDLVAGEAGSLVVLSVRRGNAPPFDVTIRRADISPPAVQSAQMLTNSIAYVCITRFPTGVADAFAKAVAKLEKHNPRAYIIDLRDNPGGLIEEALEITDSLLPEKTLITTIKPRPGTPERKIISRSGDSLKKRPLAVLVNHGSASASELLAGAVKDNKRGRLFGGKTFGKAAVQTIFRMASRPDEGMLLTTAHYCTPSGEIIQGNGISPDFEIEQTPAELRNATIKRLYSTHPELISGKASFAAPMEAADAPLEAAVAHLTEMLQGGATDNLEAAQPAGQGQAQ